MLVRRQESLEERVNLLNARIEHQESITQNHVRKLENQDKMLSAARLDRIEREQVECLYCWRNQSQFIIILYFLAHQEAFRKQQDLVVEKQEALDKLLNILLSKVQLEQDRIQNYESYLHSQGTTLEGSTISRLAQLDRVDRDQVLKQRLILFDWLRNLL